SVKTVLVLVMAAQQLSCGHGIAVRTTRRGTKATKNTVRELFICHHPAAFLVRQRIARALGVAYRKRITLDSPGIQLARLDAPQRRRNRNR
ncbi:MAG: hypothetical protein ACXVI5_06265, partial [Halobacteriota archaeon]